MKLSPLQLIWRFARMGPVLLLTLGAPAASGEEVPLVPSPPEVVDAMLKLAEVGRGDFVVDLGSGDGRIVVAAAQKFQAAGRGVEINSRWIELARARASEAGVSDRVDFVQGDLFEAAVEDATVVTLYLSSSANVRLRSRLLRELKVGSRIVSHVFDMGDWEADKTGDAAGRLLRLWIVTDKAKAAYGRP
ncbi:MAG: cyclopropane-fatty-acyl-phospholipid synthase family protein [Bryobacteraceae bacterium]